MDTTLIKRLRRYGAMPADEMARGFISTYIACCSQAADALEARAAPAGNVVGRVARAIAGELGLQDDGSPFPLQDDLTFAYLDQGEVDFAKVARAAIAAMSTQQPVVNQEAVESLNSYVVPIGTPLSHDGWLKRTSDQGKVERLQELEHRLSNVRSALVAMRTNDPVRNILVSHIDAALRAFSEGSLSHAPRDRAGLTEQPE